ncbi:hypothetical protein GGI42DRAFT_283192 [Trichoderma sp. SZMC 28013]
MFFYTFFFSSLFAVVPVLFPVNIRHFSHSTRYISLCGCHQSRPQNHQRNCWPYPQCFAPLHSFQSFQLHLN